MELESMDNIIQPIETSKVSALINAEQDDFSELPINHTIESERNTKDEIPQLIDENEINEEPYENIGNCFVIKKIIKHGIPDMCPERYDDIIINLVGRQDEKDYIIEDEKKLLITLGDCEVLEGVDIALHLMNVGEIAELEIASQLGYLDLGIESMVSSGAKLRYTVELISIKPKILPENLSLNERLRIGRKKKARGNWWYSCNEYKMALNVYRKALQYFGGPEDQVVLDIRNNEILIERIKVFNKMAHVYIKMNNLSVALLALNYVLYFEPMNEKATIRKGKVLLLKGQIMEAALELKKALEINPNNVIVQNILRKVESKLVKERKLFKNMLGPIVNNKSNTFIISGLIAGLAVICGYCYFKNNFPFTKLNT